MNSEYWSVVFEGQKVNILVNKNGYYIVDKNLFVISVDGKRLGPYESLKHAMSVISELALEG